MRKAIGIALLTLAALLGLMEGTALLAPATVQMANDGDPFGAPPSWRQHAAWIAAVALTAAVGAKLALSGGRAGARR